MSECTIILPTPLPFTPMPLPGPAVLTQNIFLVGIYLRMGFKEMAGWRSSIILVQKGLAKRISSSRLDWLYYLYCDTLGTSYSVLPETHGLILQMKKLRLREVLPDLLWSLLAFSAPAIQRPPPAIQKAFSCIFYNRQICFV